MTVAGILSAVSRRVTKAGAPWARATLEDLEGSIEVLFFPATYAQVGLQVVEDALVVLKGRPQARDDSVELIVSDLTLPDLTIAPTGRWWSTSRRPAAPAPGRTAPRSAGLASGHHRGAPAAGHRRAAAGLRLGDGFRVTPSAALKADLKALLGPARLAGLRPAEAGGVRVQGPRVRWIGMDVLPPGSGPRGGFDGADPTFPFPRRFRPVPRRRTRLSRWALGAVPGRPRPRDPSQPRPARCWRLLVIAALAVGALLRRPGPSSLSCSASGRRGRPRGPRPARRDPASAHLFPALSIRPPNDVCTPGGRHPQGRREGAAPGRCAEHRRDPAAAGSCAWPADGAAKCSRRLREFDIERVVPAARLDDLHLLLDPRARRGGLAA